MTHKMTLGANPRVIGLFAVVIAMFGVSIAGFLQLGTLYGLIFLALALFLGYQTVKFASANFRSRITTTEERIDFLMPTGESESFEWGDVTHAGYCTQPKGKPFIFVYNETADRLVTIPREYSEFDALLSRIEEATPFERYELGAGETIQQLLRRKLGIDEGRSDN